jgi:hypothetical protein
VSYRRFGLDYVGVSFAVVPQAFGSAVVSFRSDAERLHPFAAAEPLDSNRARRDRDGRRTQRRQSALRDRSPAAVSRILPRSAVCPAVPPGPHDIRAPKGHRRVHDGQARPGQGLRSFTQSSPRTESSPAAGRGISGLAPGSAPPRCPEPVRLLSVVSAVRMVRFEPYNEAPRTPIPSVHAGLRADAN